MHILVLSLVGGRQEELSQAIGELQSLDEREPLADWCIEVVRSGKVEEAPPEDEYLLKAWVSLLAKICCEAMEHRGKADDGSSAD